jgi:hypothetical protein
MTSVMRSKPDETYTISEVMRMDREQLAWDQAAVLIAMTNGGRLDIPPEVMDEVLRQPPSARKTVNVWRSPTGGLTIIVE